MLFDQRILTTQPDDRTETIISLNSIMYAI